MSAARRAPLFGRFIATGVVIGGLLALLAAVLTKGAEDYSTVAAYGYFAIGGGVVGGIVAGVVAVVLDGRAARGG